LCHTASLCVESLSVTRVDPSLQLAACLEIRDLFHCEQAAELSFDCSDEAKMRERIPRVGIGATCIGLNLREWQIKNLRDQYLQSFVHLLAS
jgi:hypothetical protein